MKEYKGSPALDAGLLAAAQAVEHYEISRYGTLKTWAEELGLNDAMRLLDQTLEEERKTDALLTKIAEAVVNQQAEGLRCSFHDLVGNFVGEKILVSLIDALLDTSMPEKCKKKNDRQRNAQDP
jgi:Domain of unknown function (DUF892)